MDSALVSVIVPTFNRAGFLPGAIASILDQTYRPLEVLLIDDGSTDETRAVAGDLQAQYGENQIRYEYKCNGGCGSALNFGMERALGSYVGMLAADDLFLDGNIKALVSKIEVTGCDFAFGGWIHDVNGVRGEFVKPIGANCPDQLVLDHFTSNPNFSLLSTLFRRECILSVGGFDESLQWNEDSDFLQRILVAGFKGEYVDRAMFVWRLHAGGKSRNRVGLRSCQIQSLQNIIEEHPELRLRLGERYPRTMAELWWLLGDAYGSEGVWGSVLEAWKQSASICRPSLFRRLRFWSVRFIGIDPAQSLFLIRFLSLLKSQD